ncbi:MAG: hypothetical protein ACLGIK_06450 [Gemmatimonadota bacterium]
MKRPPDLPDVEMGVGRGLESALMVSGAVRALIALAERSPQGATELTCVMGGYTGQGITAARALERAGLVRIESSEGIGGKPAHAIYLTETGVRVAEALRGVSHLVPETEPRRLPPGIPRARPYVEGDFKRRHGLPTKYRDDDSGEPPGEDRQE